MPGGKSRPTGGKKEPLEGAPSPWKERGPVAGELRTEAAIALFSVDVAGVFFVALVVVVKYALKL
jgi:hypothetical protein